MSQIYKSTIAEILSSVMSFEEAHFEETLDAFGPDSPAVQNHLYTKCRDLWAELELDYSAAKTVELV